MARVNPYTIDEEEQVITGGFGGPWRVEDLNDILPEGETIDRITECDCGRDRSHGATIDNGDKWNLRWCSNCSGFWGWHDARADYL